MQFHDHDTIYSFARRYCGKHEVNDPLVFYTSTLAQWLVDGIPDTPAATFKNLIHQAKAEHQWHKHGKPYLRIMPWIVPLLLKLNLDGVRGNQIMLPHPSILLQFSGITDGMVVDQHHYIRTALVSMTEGSLVSYMGWGEQTEDGVPLHSYFRLDLTDERPLSQVYADLPTEPSANLGVHIPVDLHIKVLKLIASICLMCEELVVPDVLNRDKDKPLTMQLVQRAHRNGKIGWIVGPDQTVSPHYRRGTFALYWTGPGRTVPKIVLRKGTVVHRARAEKLGHAIGEEE